jgi:hypothetical protein
MIRRAALMLGFAVFVTARLAAQMLGMPVINSGAPTGISIGADVAFANDEYYGGGGTAVGARASVGLGFLGVSGGISRFAPKTGDAVWAPGASATLRVIGGPLVPFRISLQAGASRWTLAGTDYVHVPVSLGLSATIPNPAFAIKPWIAPRVDIIGDKANTKGRFGISGGIDLSFLNGMAVRAAYDHVSASGSNWTIFSLGLGFSP